MDTQQQLIDSLTSHIALYHSCSRDPCPNPNRHPRSAILRWFSSLSIPHRQSALTIVDSDFLSVLIQMLSRLRASGEQGHGHGQGHGHFFLLTDLPSSSSLPSILFRRSRGLLRRAASADPHAAFLSSSILLFSSNAQHHKASHDSMTVSEELIGNVDRFVGIMDGVSDGGFLRGEEEAGLGRPWGELPWLKDKGYYSIEAFVANKLEIAMRMSWQASRGVKNKKGGKEKEKAAGVSGAAANAFWRQKGCIDWWLGLSPGLRKQFMSVFFQKTASTMAKEIAKEPNISVGTGTCVLSEADWLDLHGTSTSQAFLKRGRDFSLKTSFGKSHIISHALMRLVAIQEISLLSLALQWREIQTTTLFFSRLGSTHTISDYVLRNVRGVIMLVSADSMKCELMKDEKLNTLPVKRAEKLMPNHHKGKNKCRKAKSSKPMTRASKVDIELQESRDHGSGTAFSHCGCFQNDSQLATHSVIAVQKKCLDISRSLQNDLGKECDTVIIDGASRANRKKGRRKGDKSNLTSLKDAENPGLVESEVVNSLPVMENEKAKSVGLNCSSSIHPLSVSSVLGDDLLQGSHSFSCYPVSRDPTERTMSEQDNSTAVSVIHRSSCENYYINNENGEPGSVFNDLSSFNKTEKSKQTQCSSALPTTISCDKLSEVYVDNGVRCIHGSKSCCDTGARIIDAKTTINDKNIDNLITPCVKDCPSKTTPPLTCSQFSVNNQSTVIQAGNSECYAFDDATSIVSPSYEWPNMVPLSFTSVSSQNHPSATDRLHLDVGHKWPTLYRRSYLSSMNQNKKTPIESSCSRLMPSTLPMSYDWPPALKGCSRLGQSVTVGYDSGYVPRIWSPFVSDLSAQVIHVNGASVEKDMKHSRNSVDAYDVKVASDLADETEGFLVSEEESDIHAFSEEDYNQIFGGGVMYWNTTEYVGSGFSRPPSYSSEDSSWAWHEADLNRAIDDMVGVPGLSTSYNANGLSSPPAVPFCSPFDPLVSGHQVGYAVSGNDVTVQALPSSSISDASEERNPRPLNNTAIGVDGMKGDSLPYQMLRPIIVPGISRKGSRSDFKLSQDHKSPCLPSTTKDPSQIKRPPSPVVLCVPRVPRPPPPSAVGESRKRGFPIVRSGSSSPRHWSTRSCFNEGHSDDAFLQLDGTEVVWTSWGKRCLSANPMSKSIQDPILQNHIVKISQLSRDQEHIDAAFPVRCPDIATSCSQKTSLFPLHYLNDEIESFCKQVATENLVRKPYINWAVRRVTRSLQVLWPRSRTNIFGSNATGLALPASDVDLVVSLPPVRNLEPIKEAGILEGRNGIKETCIQHASRYLANQEWVRNDSLKTIENTAIPIIMLVVEVPQDITVSSGMSSLMDKSESHSTKKPCLHSFCSDYISVPSCSKSREGNSKNVKLIRLDISFKSPSHTGLQTSQLVRDLTQQFPASVPLALVLKQFLADRYLDHAYSGGLSSYCLILLIIRFLQHEHHLGRLISQNLGGLLMDFLYFFGNVFDPRQMRISIQGTGVYMKRERGLSIDPIHIDDPLHPMNNVGRNCFRIHQCIKAFADAYCVLENELSHWLDDCATTSATVKMLSRIIPSLILKDCDGMFNLQD